MTEERKYTLAEAKQVLRDQACAQTGHNILTVSREFEIHHFVCTSCRKTWLPGPAGRQTGPGEYDVDWGRDA